MRKRVIHHPAAVAAFLLVRALIYRVPSIMFALPRLSSPLFLQFSPRAASG